jgi:hypothetical protein
LEGSPPHLYASVSEKLSSAYEKMLRANMKVSLEPMVETQILELVINLLPSRENLVQEFTTPNARIKLKHLSD